MAAATTLESLVSAFRRAVTDQSSDEKIVELELRFQMVDFETFEIIYQALQNKKIKVSDGELSQYVNSILDELTPHQARISEMAKRTMEPRKRRQITFKAGKKVDDQFTIKKVLVLPYKAQSTFAMPYNVSLALEIPSQKFSSNQGATVRVQNRVSFRYKLPSDANKKVTHFWRIDLTIVNSISDSSATTSHKMNEGNAISDTALNHIINTMIRTKPLITPDNMFHVLHIDTSVQGARALYKYEIECEYLGASQNGEEPTMLLAKDELRPADITKIADSILQLSNPNYTKDAQFQSEVHHVASFIVTAPGLLKKYEYEYNLKRLLPSVIALTRTEYRKIFPPVNYYITDKADGVRAIISAREGRALIMSDKLTEFKLESSIMEKAEKKAKLDGATIVDAECVGSSYYVFDVIAVSGENVSSVGIEKRIERIPEAISVLAEYGIKAFSKVYVHLVSKNSKNLQTQFKQITELKKPYKKDGIILVGPGKPYLDTESYKWKDADHNTIDFLSKKCPKSVMGKYPYVEKPEHDLYLLFVGISYEMYEALGLTWCSGYADIFGVPDKKMFSNGKNYFPIQFSPSDNPLAYLYYHPNGNEDLDSKIIELGRDSTEWKFVKIRHDRMRDLQSKLYFGNDFYTAEMTWINFMDPFPMQQLWEGPSGDDYFAVEKEGIYKAQTAYISFIKSQRIEKFKRFNWVVDLGFGKGQDLKRYFNAEVQNLIAVDRDPAALTEAVRRKHTFARDLRKPQVHPGKRTLNKILRRGTSVHVLVADLLEPYDETLKRMKDFKYPSAGVDAVVCNLAVHYFMGSSANLRNFVTLCHSLVRPDGIVALTAMLGTKVHTLLKEEGIEEGQSWDVLQDGVRKYSIKRLYSSEVLQSYGQAIGVLLPFSNGKYYEEFLVNVGSLNDEFAKKGFEMVSISSVDKYFATFREQNSTVFDELTEDDKKYLSLYGEIVYRRKNH